MKAIISFLLFQGGWWAAILSAKWDLPILAPIITALILGKHFYLSENKRGDLKTLLLISIFGFVFDSLLIQLGWIEIKGQWGLGFSPIWLVCIWVLFGTIIEESFLWMRSRLFLAAVIGGFFGGLSYYGVQELSVATIKDPVLIYTGLISLAWGFAFPATIRIAIPKSQ